MSVQFGRWNFDGRPVDAVYLEKMHAFLAPYGPDDCGSYSKGNIHIHYRAFHTTKESRRETQPLITPSGAVLTWDGRLDNRGELIRQLRDVLTIDSTDVSIVAAAYEEWGTNCFAKLIGDWALSVWDPNRRALILAKDPIGTRHLYYSCDKEQVSWCTILDPLVLFAGKTFTLEEEYIAGCLAFFPATHLTPYVGVHSVSPSCYVRLEPRRQTITKYWDFDPSKRIHYPTDGEYEEHFRQVFAESVRHRLRSDSPILAELSGGMDSSSIVCMADALITRGVAETPRVETISYYNDSEPNWNERPYFTKVEEKRGRTGCHIDVGTQETFKLQLENDLFAATPCSIRRPNEPAMQFAACLTSQGNRVVLSGIGGDEVTGGVPTPTPELEDLLARARFRALAHGLKVWSLNKRKPWFLLLFESVRGFLPGSMIDVPKHKRPAPWLNREFVKRNMEALQGYENRVKLFGPPPSFQENLSTLNVLRRQMQCSGLSSDPPYEKRYPYLDRTLLEFLYAIPRAQLVRPGQRRSLLRRALAGIVPEELLERKRKAYVARAPLATISKAWVLYAEICQQQAGNSFGLIDPDRFCAALRGARDEQEAPIATLMRTLAVELWLNTISKSGILAGSEGETSHILNAPAPAAISAEKN